MKIKLNINDIEKSVEHIRNAADKDEKNKLYQQYISALRKLAYYGNAEAQFYLACHYEDSGTMGDPNPYHSIPKKFYWYTKAADNNDGSACSNLAIMYEKGEGCEKNIKKALELYKKSAKLGNYAGKLNYKIMLKQIKSGIYNI